MTRRSLRSAPRSRSREHLRELLRATPWGSETLAAPSSTPKRKSKAKKKQAVVCGECGGTNDLLVRERGWARCGECRSAWGKAKNANKVSPERVHELLAAGVELPACRCGAKLELQGRRPPALWCDDLGQISGGLCRGCLNVFAEQKRQAIIVGELEAGATVPSLLARGYPEASVFGAKASMKSNL